MRSINNPKLKFYNIGIWKFDGNYLPPNDPNNGNLSATNFNTQTYFTLPCKSISTLMNEHNHKLIDVLKMDIEGASFEIKRFIRQKDLPKTDYC